MDREFDLAPKYRPYLARRARNERKRTHPHIEAMFRARRHTLSLSAMRARLEDALGSHHVSVEAVNVATQLLVEATQREAVRIAAETIENYQREQQRRLAEGRPMQRSVRPEHVPRSW